MFMLRSDTAPNPPLCFRVDGERVADAQISADSRYVMAHYDNGAVRLWDTHTGKPAFVLQDAEVKVVRAGLSPKGTYLLTVSDDGVSQLWKTGNGKEQTRFSGYDYQVSAVRFTHDERRVVTGTEDGTVYFWSTRNGSDYQSCRGQQGYPITSIDIARDNRKAVTVSHLGRTMVVWDTGTGKPLAFDARNEENRPMQAAFDPSGELLVVPTIHGLGETRILKNASWPSEKWQDSIQLMAGRLEGMQGRSEYPVFVTDSTLEGDWGEVAVFSPDGRTLAILHRGSTIVLWDWPSRRRRHSIPHHEDMLTRIRFSADSRFLITAPNVPAQIIPDGGQLEARISRVYDVGTGNEVLVLFGHNDLVMAAEIAANGERILTAGMDGQVLLWGADPQVLARARDAGDTAPIVAALRADAARMSVAGGDLTQQLTDAARDGNASDMRALLEAGADPGLRLPDARPLLLEAAWNDHIETVKVLLEYGADVNEAADSGQTALHIAALRNAADLLRVLLDHDPFIDAQQESTGRTPLHEAIGNDSREIAEMLLQRGADPNTTFKREEGRYRTSVAETALMLATERGDLDLVKQLLEHGARPDDSNEFGETALHLAVQAESEALVRALLEAGANPQPDSPDAKSPLQIAIDRRNNAIADLLLTAGAKIDFESETATGDLYEIAKNGGHPALAEQLLEQGANPARAVKSDFTPLHIAATNGHADIVDAMVARCTDVDVRLGSGATPLISAAIGGHLRVVRSLLKAGADPTATTSFGETALKGAIRNRHGDTIVALIDGGAPFDAGSKEAAEMLNLACRDGLVALARKLLTAGVEVRDSYRSQAGENGHDEIVDLLTAAGAAGDASGGAK